MLALSWSYLNGVLKSEILLGKQQTGRNIKKESTEKFPPLEASENKEVAIVWYIDRVVPCQPRYFRDSEFFSVCI